jgi:SAM-dependent methyltransferase
MNRDPLATEALAFWENPARVAEFAAREPDLRLLDIMREYADPRATRVLDLGCAGGRNTEPLLAGGFDVIAVDASRAMVAATRARVAPLCGAQEAERRVFVARMDDLSLVDDDTIDLVVALGIYQQAQDEEEWTGALAETARIVNAGGRVLIANFAPGTGPRANPPVLVAGTRFLYSGLKDGRACLLSADALDREFARLGFTTEVPTRTVDRSSEESGRITVNALYRKAT